LGVVAPNVDTFQMSPVWGFKQSETSGVAPASSAEPPEVVKAGLDMVAAGKIEPAMAQLSAHAPWADNRKWIDATVQRFASDVNDLGSPISSWEVVKTMPLTNDTQLYLISFEYEKGVRLWDIEVTNHKDHGMIVDTLAAHHNVFQIRPIWLLDVGTAHIPSHTDGKETFTHDERQGDVTPEEISQHKVIYQEGVDITVSKGNTSHTERITVYGIAGLRFPVGKLEVDHRVRLSRTTIKIVDAKNGFLIPSQDSPVPVNMGFDRTQRFGISFFTHAVNCSWTFTKAGIVFSAGGETYESENAGAFISFTDDGVKTEGLKLKKKYDVTKIASQPNNTEKGNKSKDQALNKSLSSTATTDAHKESVEPPLTWDAVAGSNDITKYAAYIKQHPKDHVADIRGLVETFLQKQVAEAEQAGKRIIHNAKKIHPNSPSGSFMWIGGGMLELGPVVFYSDPTNTLAVRTGSYQYFEGKGIAITSDAVYCFGF